MRPDPKTLIELLELRAARTPARAALYWEDRPISYEALWDGVNRFALLLTERGVTRGDRVLIRLKNGPEFFQAFYGALRAGAIAIPVFPGSSPQRIAALARLSGAETIVVPDVSVEEAC